MNTFLFCAVVCVPLCVSLVVGCGRGEAPLRPSGAKQGEGASTALSAERQAEFVRRLQSKDERAREAAVCERLFVEKQAELNRAAAELEKEFGLLPNRTYTYEGATRSLYLLSTNEAGQDGRPARERVRTAKSDGEAQYLVRLMVTRSLTERQLQVLDQLVEEKRGEARQTETLLRQDFHLDPRFSYRLDAKTGQLLRLVHAPRGAETNETNETKAPATQGKATL